MTTHNTSPHSCREYIEQAAMEDEFIGKMIADAANKAETMEQMLEMVVVSLLENRRKRMTSNGA